MKKFYIPVLGLLLLALQPALAQNPAQKTSAQTVAGLRNFVLTSTQPISTTAMPGGNGQSNGFNADRCGYTVQFNKAVAAGYNKAAFEAVINRKVEEIRAARASGQARFANYTIPVVFHIIHDGTAEGTGANLSAAQVYQQIDQLNKDFGNQSGSTFPQAADAGITFCPVTVDPSGNVLAQPGVDRINRITRGWTNPTTFGSSDPQVNAMINYIDGTIKPASIWDPTRFVNVWAYNFSNSGLLGYATFPTAGLPGLPAGETATTAGCVFLSGSLGSVASPGTAGQYALGRTVGHEIGHFLGLYHVWGDEDDCSGTDECADTPPCSGRYFSTVPGCTIPTQCSGQPRMIQNYMDYSDDGCMNTYTQNQVDRMQAVMLVAPRRPGSSGLCAPPVTNALDFTSTTTTTTETGVGTTCPVYRDYTVSVKPAVAANGNATVSFTFSGTAVRNSDYEVIGASSLNYTNGDAATKNITIRVHDDAVVESAETIIINYSITGAGLVAGTFATTHTINITDNDFTPSINNTTPIVTLLSQDFGAVTGSNQVPAGWTTTTGTNKWVGNPSGAATYGFTGNILHISNGGNAAVNNGTAALNYDISVTTDARATTPTLAANGLKNISVTFDFVCNGEADADDVYDAGIVYYTLDGTNFSAVTELNGDFILQGISTKTTKTLYMPAEVVGNNNLRFMFRWVSDNGVGNQPPFAIDNVVIRSTNIAVESQQGQSATETVMIGNNTHIFYSDADNQIIASVTNPSASLGCITANVASQGDGITILTTNTGVYSRSNKVINLSPATANTTATYQATFYFTTSELAAWGVSAPNLKLMKVATGVNLGSVLTGANSQVVTATFDDQRATRGYASYTGSFTGGFSQFMLVSPTATLPVSTLTFDAKPNIKNILLNWSTTTEINNKGFVIERSTDGSHFETIGWMDGAMNSSDRKNYSYTDNFVQPNQLYYYRLRQTDIDSRESLSAIRQARINDRAVLQVSISPNPASNEVKVFTSGTAGLSNINLLDAKGQLVKTWKQVNCSAAPQSLDISKIAAGVYMIQVVTGDAITTEKLIIN